MTTRRHALRTHATRCLVVGFSLAWGLVEFLALQRSRYHARRLRA